MPTFYDTETGQPQNIPSGQAEDQFLAGKVGLPQDQPANLFDPQTGSTYAVPTEKVETAIQSGFKFEDNDQQALREYRQEVKSSPWTSGFKTFLGQAGNQALIGLPEFAADKVQGEDSLAAQKRQILKDEDPVSNIAGGLSGFGLSLFYGGPLWEGVGYAGEAAARTATSVARAFGTKAAESYAAKAAAIVAKGATEGALISAPQAITEAALGDHHTVGEALIAGLSTDLEGAAAGGALTSGAALLGKLGSPVSMALKAAGKNIDTDTVNELATRLQLKQFDFMKPQIRAISKLDNSKTAIENMQDVVDFANDRGWTGMGAIGMNASDRADEFIKYRETLENRLNTIRSKADELQPEGWKVEDVRRELEGMQKQYADEAAHRDGSKRDVISIGTQLEQSLGDLAKEKGLPTVAAGDGTKRAGDDLTLSVEEMAKVRDRLKSIAYPISDPTKPWIRNASSPGAESAYRVWTRKMDDSLDTLINSETGGSLKDELQGARKDYARMRKLEGIFREPELSTLSRNPVSINDMLASGAGATIGGLPGAVAGSGINMMRRKYGNQMAASVLYGVAGILDRVQGRVFEPLDETIAGGLQSGVSGFSINATDVAKAAVGAVGRPVSKAAVPESVQILNQYFHGDDTAPTDRREMINRLGQDLAAYRADPDRSAGIMQAVTDSLSESAPTVQAAMQGRMNMAIDYLSREIPKPDEGQSLLNKSPFVASDRQLSQFERKLQIVFNPISMVSDIQKGTLTAEHVAAMEAVYPNMLDAIRLRVLKQLAGIQTPLSNKLRNTLGILLGDAAPGSVTPAGITLLQQNFTPPPPPKPRANSKINEAGRIGNDIDRVIQR